MACINRTANLRSKKKPTWKRLRIVTVIQQRSYTSSKILCFVKEYDFRRPIVRYGKLFLSQVFVLLFSIISKTAAFSH
jgi:hypothetical protein